MLIPSTSLKPSPSQPNRHTHTFRSSNAIIFSLNINVNIIKPTRTKLSLSSVTFGHRHTTAQAEFYIHLHRGIIINHDNTFNCRNLPKDTSPFKSLYTQSLGIPSCSLLLQTYQSRGTTWRLENLPTYSNHKKKIVKPAI